MIDKTKALWNSTTNELTKEDIDWYNTIIENPEKAFPIDVYPLLKTFLDDFHGKKICVPSSGDNTAAFGFHLLGAKVTSCDLSENQIRNARQIAELYKWDIEFYCENSMNLQAVNNDEYDLIYTSNGVHVWINDLIAMYSGFYNKLKNGGYYIFFDTHPMIRPFDNSRADTVKISRHYKNDIIVANEDGVPRHHWRAQDFVNAAVQSGFYLKHMEEFHSRPDDLDSHNYLNPESNPQHPNYGLDLFDWKVNPWAALPQCLCLCLQKLNSVYGK